MPELPEVEAARRALEEHCVGKRIRRCTVADDPKVIDGGISPSDFEASLVGKTLVAALRKGKNMWLQLDSPPFPSFQFGMAGAIYIKGVAVTRYKRSIVKDTEEWPSKYSKVFVELDDGLEFSFTDKRRFARVRLLDNPTSVPPISELGPDALLEPMSIDKFVDSLSKKKMAIKALLLDQSYIAGIGNWIADEVLYQAKVHPLQVAATLSREKCEALHKCISQVIDTALEVGADSSQYPRNWIFHFREMKPGKAFVDGKRIEFITAGGRTSAFVPELQKLDGATSEKLSTRQTSNKDQEEEEDTESKEKRPRTTRNSGRAPLTKLKSEGDSTERGKRKEKKRKETKKPESRSRENDRQSKEKVRRKEEDVTETEGVKTSQARRQKKKKARKS